MVASLLLAPHVRSDGFFLSHRGSSENADAENTGDNSGADIDDWNEVDVEDVSDSDTLSESAGEVASGQENEADETDENHDEADGDEASNDAGTKYVDSSEHHNIHVAVEVDGNKLQMLVDTGASISLMSKPLAKRLGLLSRMDRSMDGSINGIGEAKVFGALWNIPVKVGGTNFPMSFYVVSVDEPLLLLGVDQLRQFKCVVDLNRNRLVFGGHDSVEVPFLPYQRDRGLIAQEPGSWILNP